MGEEIKSEGVEIAKVSLRIETQDIQNTPRDKIKVAFDETKVITTFRDLEFAKSQIAFFEGEADHWRLIVSQMEETVEKVKPL